MCVSVCSNLSFRTISTHSCARTQVDLGGFAGGEKYITQGILFKFASDKYGLYGGDEYAMKAAGHELKGLMGFYKCQVRA